MTASETPGTFSRVVVGLLTAILSFAILSTLMTGLAEDGDSQKESAFEDFVSDVNTVCEGEKGSTGKSVTELGSFAINRSENKQNKVFLVNNNEEVEMTDTVECDITDEFRISEGYEIERNDQHSPATVTVSQNSASQVGGL